MAKASLRLPITDVLNEPLAGMVKIDFQPDSPGGVSMHTGDIDLQGATELTVTDIECLGGPGTRYKVSISSDNYRTYSYFQMIMEGANRTPENHIRLVVNPKRVEDIDAPAFAALHTKLQAFLKGADPIVRDPEDKDLKGLNGATLFRALGELRKAALLNLFTKAKHASSGGAFRFLEGQTLLVVRQDRFFSTIDPAVEDFLTRHERFKSAPDALHTPLSGYTRRGSFKSRDEHGNLQITLMQDAAGNMAADIDIDEASGLGHGIEVIRNKFHGRTNPYLVRDLLVLSEVEEQTLDPGYRFKF